MWFYMDQLVYMWDPKTLNLNNIKKMRKNKEMNIKIVKIKKNRIFHKCQCQNQKIQKMRKKMKKKGN